MNTVALAAQAVMAALEIYRIHAGKPAGWKPGPADWDALAEWANRTPEQIKAEGIARLAGKKP